MEDYFVDDFEGYKGQTLSFKIVELDKDKNRLILSHRAVVEAEKASQKKNVINQIKAGDVLDGKVQRLASFGAFIDLGGIDGLVHISQVSHEHVSDVSEVLAEGQDVKVKFCQWTQKMNVFLYLLKKLFLDHGQILKNVQQKALF